MLRFVWLSEEPRLELMAPEEPEALCGVAHVGYGLEFWSSSLVGVLLFAQSGSIFFLI